MAFRPCIDLRDGKVVQIVGGTYTPDQSATTQVNFVSERPSTYYAELYQSDNLTGGHIIMLGPGSEEAARAALKVYPGGMQIGGGINVNNAKQWLSYGATHVIVTSWLFVENQFSFDRLVEIARAVGKNRLVVDLSCRRSDSGDYFVTTNQWRTVTKTRIDQQLILEVESQCDELLIHAADVEGKVTGIDQELVMLLRNLVSVPTTYAGGATAVEDINLVSELSHGKIDLTIGSALDIFGGSLVKYADAAKLGHK